MFMRLGSSGGVGVEPGTVVATTQGLNGLLEPSFTLPVLGRNVTRPTDLDADLNAAIVAASEGRTDGFAVLPGKTMGTDCFYEGQARLDGAVEARDIKLGVINGDSAQVVDGLHAGEQIVTRGALFIDRAASGDKAS